MRQGWGAGPADSLVGTRIPASPRGGEGRKGNRLPAAPQSGAGFPPSKLGARAGPHGQGHPCSREAGGCTILLWDGCSLPSSASAILKQATAPGHHQAP